MSLGESIYTEFYGGEYTFFGIMILATVVCYSIVGMHLSKIALIVGVIGAIMSVFNFNLMSF